MPRKHHNLNNGNLADQYGELHLQAREIKKSLDEMRTEAIRRGFTEAQGDRFRLRVVTAEAKRLDTKAIKTEMSDDWIERHTVSSEVTKLLVD